MVDGAGKVTAYDSSCFAERVVGVETVDRVEGNVVDLDKDFSWAGSWDVDFAQRCGL